MARDWTNDQKKVIELHKRNILVSAAAGSGKTAVLVERIIKMVTDKEKNIEIDRLVVVTFTKAAAGEMRQRISEAIEEMLEQEPDNEKLQRQLTLIHNAQITTIDSFCLYLIKNNFALVDMDPGFKTADEGELKLLEAEVMTKLLEDFYMSERKEFLDLVDAYSNGKNDLVIEELIYKIYRYVRSYPWPKEWLDLCREFYNIKDESDMKQNNAVCYVVEYIKKILQDYKKIYEKLEHICMEEDGPFMYQPAIADDKQKIEKMLSIDDFYEFGEVLGNMQFEKLSSKRGKDVDADKKEYVKFYRDQYKKSIQGIHKKFFQFSMNRIFSDIMLNKPSILMLLELAENFYEAMQEAKKEKNIIDFNDMEHIALNILVRKEGSNLIYTEAADKLSDFYEEILIDEYQDSNLLQEQILYSISRGRKNVNDNNMFMVGDVKQSIYKFRLARPELFIQKYKEYTSEDSLFQKIELKKNFRSRKNVLMTINDIFLNIMKDYFGGITYDENSMLYEGFQYPEPEMAGIAGGSSEVLLVDLKSMENQKAETEADDDEYSEKELEAQAVANRIKKLMDLDNGQLIYDGKLEGYRRIHYRDIVVLTRSITGTADIFMNVLMDNGIPAYTEVSKGYFDTREIKLLLSLLAVIDNPFQDIPLAAVLLSYFGRMNAAQLAGIRKTEKGIRLYQSLLEYGEGENEIQRETQAKIDIFLEQLEQYRKRSIYTSIHEFLWELIYDTGYYDYVGTMPAGKRRQANLDMLIEKAKTYEETSYRGLFHFLRYIEKLKKYEVEYGEASSLSESEDLVRIMSIHKSKGLEFPVVFVVGMGRTFNNNDLRAGVLIDSELGVGANAVDLLQRTKVSTIFKNAIGIKLKLENLYEELRILYVALTRAKEKLIMTGTVKNADKSIEEWKRKAEDLCQSKAPFLFVELEKCSTYFDFIVPTALKKYGNTGVFEVHRQQYEEIMKGRLITETEDFSEVSDGIMENEQIKRQVYCYPYSKAADSKSKYTVSEMKKMQTIDADEFLEDIPEFLKQENDSVIPEFIKGVSEFSGALKGTAYHRVLECFDYDYGDSPVKIKEYLEILVEKNMITRQQCDVIDSAKLYCFFNSGIGQRIKKQYHKTLKREQPFVLGKKNEEGETILIQGVIDLYFEESDGAVIVDYKTDYVPQKDGEEILIKRYQIQLDYYAEALSTIMQKKVKEKVIYSFALGKELRIPTE